MEMIDDDLHSPSYRPTLTCPPPSLSVHAYVRTLLVFQSCVPPPLPLRHPESRALTRPEGLFRVLRIDDAYAISFLLEGRRSLLSLGLDGGYGDSNMEEPRPESRWSGRGWMNTARRSQEKEM